MSVRDASGADVGAVLDFPSGFVLRRFGQDKVMVQVSVNGFVQTPISFMHTSGDCSGPRYLVNLNGPAFAFYGQVLGDRVVYTRAVDPTQSQVTAVNSMETVSTPAELAGSGACMATPGFYQSVGTVVVVTDPGVTTLATPFHVE